MGVNSLPKTVTRQRRDCDLNPGPSAPESSTLTTRLPSHPFATNKPEFGDRRSSPGERRVFFVGRSSWLVDQTASVGGQLGADATRRTGGWVGDGRVGDAARQHPITIYLRRRARRSIYNDTSATRRRLDDARVT